MDAPFVSPHLRFLEPLGRGGTADVAKAHATHLNRTVAVKYPLQVSDDPTIDFASLAKREWDLIGGARFPGLVRLWEAPSRDPDYLLLELCPGPTLDTVPKIDSLETTLAILSAVATGLEFLNAAGLVHGDLKPHNIFLPPDGRRCRRKACFMSSCPISRWVAASTNRRRFGPGWGRSDTWRRRQ